MSVDDAHRARRESWQAAATDEDARKVLMELCRDFTQSPPAGANLGEFERGRFEGSRDKSMAIVREIVQADKKAGVRFIADLIEGTELWQRKTRGQKERQERKGQQTPAPSRAETPEVEA